jgi:hypothetical protein
VKEKGTVYVSVEVLPLCGDRSSLTRLFIFDLTLKGATKHAWVKPARYEWVLGHAPLSPFSSCGCGVGRRVRK